MDNELLRVGDVVAWDAEFRLSCPRAFPTDARGTVIGLEPDRYGHGPLAVVHWHYGPHRGRDMVVLATAVMRRAA